MSKVALINSSFLAIFIPGYLILFFMLLILMNGFSESAAKIVLVCNALLLPISWFARNAMIFVPYEGKRMILAWSLLALNFIACFLSVALLGIIVMGACSKI